MCRCREAKVICQTLNISYAGLHTQTASLNVAHEFSFPVEGEDGIVLRCNERIKVKEGKGKYVKYTLE